MKKITILMLAFLAVSCIEKNDVRPGSPLDVDIDHYQTARTYDVPVKEGCITVVKAYGVTLAEAESPMRSSAFNTGCATDTPADDPDPFGRGADDDVRPAR